MSGESSRPVPRERAFSLPYALLHIARTHGIEIDFDDLLSALGLSAMICAAPQEPDAANWPMYGRDAFVMEGARLLGLTLREIHPREAARGLERAAEFEQHFEASYRPLIENALQHGEPVLAWRGWSGPYELYWGLIEGAGASGFSGRIFPAKGEGVEVALARPAVQVYVVERCSHDKACGGDLLEEALVCLLRQEDSQLAATAGVLMGAQAVEFWIGRLRGDLDNHARHASHVALARSILAGFESLRRFLSRHAPAPAGLEAAALAVDRWMAKARTCLERFVALGELQKDAATLSGELEQAREAMMEACAALRGAGLRRRHAEGMRA